MRVSNLGMRLSSKIHEERAMPAKRQLTMRQIRRLWRLQHEGVATRQISRILGVARSTVQDALKGAETAGLSWPLADEVTDEDLEGRLFGQAG